MPPDELILLEGGSLEGQTVDRSTMTHAGVGVYVLRVADGNYRHDEEAIADFRDGQRVAIFEPALLENNE